MRYSCAIVCIGWGCICSNVYAQQPTAADLIQMDFEDLVNMDVAIQSAGKSVTKALDLTYAAHVITAAEIRQSGVQNIPDALRLAPGVSVNQISTAEWSVGIRGTGGLLSRFVLILVDGRVAYNNVFSGANWDELNISMDQIARIEVIRGPNGTAWGANAVNGIINIITRSPVDDNERWMSAWRGDNEQAGASFSWSHPLRHDWMFGLSAHARQWGGSFIPSTGVREAEHKDWRASARAGRNSSTAQTRVSGDFFSMQQAPYWAWIDRDSARETVGEKEEDKWGYTVQLNHQQQLGDNFSWQVRGSAEHIDRDTTLYSWLSTSYQFDAEFEYRSGPHKWNAGVNTRYNKSNVVSSPDFDLEFVPEQREVNNYGVFVSDNIDISDAFALTLAARLDDSDLGTTNLQPSLRGLWRVSDTDRMWAAVSEATTSPARSLSDIENAPYRLEPAKGAQQPLPVLLVLDGYPAATQDDTRIRAQEIGYRRIFGSFSVDLALFDYAYENELGYVLQPDAELIFSPDYQPSHVVQHFNFQANRTTSAHGGEVVLMGQVMSNWSTEISYSRVIKKDNQSNWSSTFLMLNNLRLSETLDMMLAVRHSHGSTDVSAYYGVETRYGTIDNYWVADVNLNWKFSHDWQLELIARNLGDKHTEGIREEFSTAIEQVETLFQAKVSFHY